MSYPIASVCPSCEASFKAAGVRTTATLLQRAKDPKGRKLLAAETGLAGPDILRAANRADLMRLRGVGEDYARLLEAAGVDTVKALRNRNPGNLAKAIAQVNGGDRKVQPPPSERMVAKWILQAKTIPPVMTY
ncbi:DUF4332 domain-containing protein [Methylopila sp. M107]|uniref:DUF4332 domain-containing protein n=1 Tax=Methylopila sp. M107 TaxID=1101190 RepID=UPI000382AA4D|nr:DUF4332 domain-containing protein [Methylopila sp. M107]